MKPQRPDAAGLHPAIQGMELLVSNMGLADRIGAILREEMGCCSKEVVRKLLKLFTDETPVDISGKDDPYSPERHKPL
jgi:hypothetical protein